MKKYSFSVAVILAALVFLLFSCNGEIGSDFCTVTVDFANGTEPVTTEVPAGFEFILTSTVPAREGYEFSYWEGSDGVRYSSGDKIKITSDMTFRAVWIEEGTLGEDEAFVSFYLNGSLFAKQKIKKGTKATPPSLTEMNISDGFDFDGWYVGDVKFDFNAVISDSIILTATCVRKTCTVTYDYGGDREQTTVSVNWGDVLTRPSDPTDPESCFDGWYRDGNKYFFDTAVEESFTLRAEWIGKNQVSVNIRYNNGENDYREILPKGGFYSLPDISGHVREGHDFSGWYVGSDETLHNPGEQIVLSESRDISAEWTTRNYTVSFDSAGGSAVDDIVLPWNSLFTPPESKQTGYTLKGWYDGEEKYTSKTRITKDVTLTAKWEVAVYEVIFLSDEGGAVTAQKQVKHGEKISATSKIPSRKGHTFTGNWLKEDNTVFDFSSSVTGSITLHPEWTANSISVTFMNGDEEFCTETVKWGEKLNRPESDPTSESTQKFLYWSSDGTNGFDFSSPVESDSALTLQAVFAGSSDYVVTFDYNDGVTATEIKKAQSGSFHFPTMLELPEKEGEVITAWRDSKGTVHEMEWTDSDGRHYELYSTPMTITEDMTFTAVWSKKKVSVYINSFSDDVYDTYEIDWGSTISQPADPVKREDRTFMYWHTSDIWNTPYDFSTPVTQGSITLYAEWDRTSVSYTLNPDNGEKSICGDVRWGETITPCIDPLKDGKVFLGWFEEGSSSPFDFNTGLRKDTVLTARWGDSPSESVSGKVTVTYDLDGNGTNRTITVDRNSRIYPYRYTPSSTGTLAFDYWKDESGNKLDGSDLTITEDTTFTAVWTNNMVTVTFCPGNTPSNGPSDDITETIAYGSKITSSIKPDDPERENCVFLYWIDSTYGYGPDSKPFDFDNTTITQNTRLTAVWDKDLFLVTFNPGNGEASSKSVELWGYTIYPPADPVWDGHIFTGWFTEDGSEFDFSTPITGTTVLTAHWSEEEEKKDGKSTITFDWNDELTVETVTVVTGSEYRIDSYKPQRKGYTLVAWKTESGDEINVENGIFASRKIDSDIYLTAQWKIREMELYFYLNEADFYGGSGDNHYADANLGYGQKIKDKDVLDKLVSPEKDGYTFDGWLDMDSGVCFNPDDAFCPSSEGTNYFFFASWIPVVHTVNVDYGYDGRTDSVSVNHDDTLILPTPKRSGYRFTGWKIKDSEDYYAMTPVAGDMSLTAEWEETVTYSVHFMYPDGTECSEKEVESGKSVSVSDIEVIAPEGTFFRGWYEGDETFDPFIYAGDSYSFDNPVYGDLYLYAKFTFDNIASSWAVAGGIPLILTVTDGRNVIMSAMGSFEDMYEVGEWSYDSSTGQIEFTFNNIFGVYIAGKMPWFNPNSLGKTGEFLTARKLYTTDVVRYESRRRTAVKDSIVGEWRSIDGRWDCSAVFTDEKSMETLLMYSDAGRSGEPLVTIRSTADYRKGESGEYTYLDEKGYDSCGEIEVSYSSLVSYAVSATELGTYGFVMDSVSFTKSDM